MQTKYVETRAPLVYEGRMGKEKRKFSKQPPALPRKSESFNAPGRHKHKSNNAPAAMAGGQYWLYGRHAVEAAMGNKERRIARLLVSPAATERLTASRAGLNAQTVEPSELDRLLGASAVHQGIAALVHPLEPFVLEDVLHQESPSGPMLVLDQVSDPQNVGAILRSAAAFSACALLAPKDHSAPESAAMAKAA
ncbi:MAG: TrmH family RNA methyltransferase, partial [Rickettsiales bacterium]